MLWQVRQAATKQLGSGHQIAGAAWLKISMQSFDVQHRHSNIPAERFIAMLRTAGVNAIAMCARRRPSRRFPWFSSKKLGAFPARRRHFSTYRSATRLVAVRATPRSIADAVADYEKMARQPEFCAGLDRLLAMAAQAPRLPDVRRSASRSIAIAVC